MKLIKVKLTHAVDFGAPVHVKDEVWVKRSPAETKEWVTLIEEDNGDVLMRVNESTRPHFYRLHRENIVSKTYEGDIAEAIPTAEPKLDKRTKEYRDSQKANQNQS